MLEPTITIRITDKMLDICFESQNYTKLNSSLQLLSKRRSQHDDVLNSSFQIMFLGHCFYCKKRNEFCKSNE